MEELTGKIDLYLKGLLPADDHAAFEAEIASDPALKAEVDLQRKTTALLEAAAFEETRQQVAELNTTGQRSSSKYTILKVAASLMLLVGLGYYLIHIQYSDAALYSAYNEAYPDRITTMGATDQTASKALEFYAQENYAAAANEFKILAEAGLYEARFTIYEAIALTNSAHAPEAIKLLEQHLETKPIDAIACEWQLILAYLADDRGDQAEGLLIAFLEHNAGYQNKNASALLGELGSVWR